MHYINPGRLNKGNGGKNMKKKFIIIFVCIMLVLTSATISALNEESELLGINSMTQDILFDEKFKIISYTDACIMPDNGFGTIDLPAICPYIAPDDPMYIIDGLSSGTTMELDPTLDNFYNILSYPGGLLGGEVHTFDATLQLAVSGTGSLAGFNRNLATPVSLEIHTGPRTPGDPIQMFPSDIFQLYGEIFGDPDFCTFRVIAGSDYGLPSPGQFTLTEFIPGNFNVDSFFDITYQIEFEGCPGSILEGLSGTTTATTRLQQGEETINTPPHTPSKPNGPTTVSEATQYTYTTSTIDLNGDNVKYGFDFDNDGIIEPSHWSSLIPSGVIFSIKITFYGTGTRYLRAKAEDEHGAQSGFSSALVITVTGANNPPNTPSTPSGPSSGNMGSSLSFSTSATDPDDDTVKYGWDWDGDDTVDEWSGFLSSGSIDSRSHSWSSFGTYDVKVKAEDENGGQSAFSTSKTVVISFSNNPPDKPSAPSGPNTGKPDATYQYSAYAIDPDGDQVLLLFDWGDGSDSGWNGPVNSGQSITVSNEWSEDGDYTIKVKAMDTNFAESEWSDPLIVSMPKSKSNIPFGLIFVFGFDVDVKLVQLESGEDYVDLELLSKSFYIWENEIQTRNPGEFIRLYNAKGLFLPSLSICFGICNDWSIIG